MSVDMEVGFQHAYCIMRGNGEITFASQGYLNLFSIDHTSIERNLANRSARIKSLSLLNVVSYKNYTIITQSILERNDGSKQLLEMEYTRARSSTSTDFVIVERARPALTCPLNVGGIDSIEGAVGSIKRILSDLAFMASKWNLTRMHSALADLADSARY